MGAWPFDTQPASGCIRAGPEPPARPRFAAFTLAARMTLATLPGVGQLADHETASMQMAQTAAVHPAGV